MKIAYIKHKIAIILLIWSALPQRHKSFNYIFFIHFEENIPNKTIIQKHMLRFLLIYPSFFSPYMLSAFLPIESTRYTSCTGCTTPRSS